MACGDQFQKCRADTSDAGVFKGEFDGTPGISNTQDPWVHRSEGMRCKTCIWFVEKQRAQRVWLETYKPVGRCRRHAPTIGGYPVVFESDWCGDHRLDENKA